ncbi:DNA polymerase III subunit delta [Actinomyces sp. B33]|uniref:DNA polymerase III subunit delta n=1 Tax=Actinomyces sp. B33 TaxID=2942131 RepID=UPI0023402CD1|nr:DNA polymerase III subunit delta [Actinomyces sp. B33]MDC4232818.1 DNA polymerase III subunit delta [Actinomyces sp. B33]
MPTRKQADRGPVEIRLAPVVLVKGSEGVLVDRALDSLRAQALQADPAVERTDLSAASYQSGQLGVIASPSLFGESRLIIVPDLEAMSDALAEDLLAYIADPADDVWLLLVHPGGNARGKKVVDAVAKARWPVIPADPIKRDSEKLDLVRADVRAARRQMDAEAMQALVDALGSDLRSMCAAVSQLLSDVQGRITIDDVRRYQAGRIEATGFDVADAAVLGDTARALTLLRHAYATGVDPQPIIIALAMKFRALAKVSVAGSKGPGALKMAPWQIDRARRELRGWTDQSLAGAIRALAVADEETKGASRDPHRAVEKAVITICRLRGAR